VPIRSKKVAMAETQQLHVKVRNEDGALWATVDEFPGVFAAGDDLDELRESLEEGVALVLEREDGEIPVVTIAPLKLGATADTAKTELVCA
jgi:predicted RNase H-like HicB family nuclease